MAISSKHHRRIIIISVACTLFIIKIAELKLHVQKRIHIFIQHTKKRVSTIKLMHCIVSQYEDSDLVLYLRYLQAYTNRLYINYVDYTQHISCRGLHVPNTSAVVDCMYPTH